LVEPREQHHYIGTLCEQLNETKAVRHYSKLYRKHLEKAKDVFTIICMGQNIAYHVLQHWRGTPQRQAFRLKVDNKMARDEDNEKKSELQNGRQKRIKLGYARLEV
jgi:hypothetical protein